MSGPRAVDPDEEFAGEVWEDESPAQGDWPPTPHEPGWRTETDTLGPILVQADRLWGAQTQRSLRHFAIGPVMPSALVHAYGSIKAACASVNGRLGELPQGTADLIARVSADVESGLLDDQFPVRVYTTGSGTHLNANANEVIANRANQRLGKPLGSHAPIHPNDHVNRSQSSNDTFVTAMHVALLGELSGFMDAARGLEQDLGEKARAWRDIPKMGRTHLMDATQLSVGEEWGAFGASLASALGGVDGARRALSRVALGGTAVGSGLNTPPGFREAVVRELADRTGQDLTVPDDPFAAQSTIDAVVELHAGLRRYAIALFKIANDLRWLASGPRGGLQELVIPINEPGSTIMPGKANPTQAEAVLMACQRVMGNDVTVGMAGAEGNFQLNAFRPVAIAATLESLELLRDSSASLAAHLVRGAALNLDQLQANASGSVMTLTSLTPILGYERVAQIAHRAMREGTSARQAALDEGVDPAFLEDLH